MKEAKQTRRVQLAPQIAAFVDNYAARWGMSASEVMQRAIEMGIPELASMETKLLINEKSRRQSQSGQLE